MKWAGGYKHGIGVSSHSQEYAYMQLQKLRKDRTITWFVTNAPPPLQLQIKFSTSTQNNDVQLDDAK